MAPQLPTTDQILDIADCFRFASQSGRRRLVSRPDGGTYRFLFAA